MGLSTRDFKNAIVEKYKFIIGDKFIENDKNLRTLDIIAQAAQVNQYVSYAGDKIQIIYDTFGFDPHTNQQISYEIANTIIGLIHNDNPERKLRIDRNNSGGSKIRFSSR